MLLIGCVGLTPSMMAESFKSFELVERESVRVVTVELLSIDENGLKVKQAGGGVIVIARERLTEECLKRALKLTGQQQVLRSDANNKAFSEINKAIGYSLFEGNLYGKNGRQM